MNYGDLNDLQLITLLQEENEDAFSEMYKRYWKAIYTMAFTYVKSSETAQDIVQDIFVKLWTRKENLVGVKEFKPYLFVTARNHIISSLRNKVFHVYLHPDERVEEEILLPESQLLYKEAVEILYRAIEQLPSQQQKAYKLSRYEGMRYEKIAEEMGISKLTVRTHISNALSSIRTYFKSNGLNPLLYLLFL